ncbi:hypothetical protein CYMTET_36714 [Cymbomonas tetramitiformis]|uniref:Endonuclease/exonuclease/phosphatase domain-containing protein n=1 Tax=Cymbomonas tetramitiformis TaxID=36881 RepID=A0AAE0CHS1_9CHLO|nr:hypothetical protein CYMTET_36714 [Cymbomonas tetramitiformis]
MKEDVQHIEEGTEEVEVVGEMEAKKPRIQEDKAQGIGAANAFMRRMTQDYTKERVEETMRGQGVSMQALMEVGEILRAMREEDHTLIRRTMETLEKDGHTQIAIRDREKWGIMMLTATGRDIQAHVWVPTGRMREQNELLGIVDTVLQAGDERRHIGTEGSQTNNTGDTTRTGVMPTSNAEGPDGQMDDNTALTMTRGNAGDTQGEEGVRCTERLVQTTLQFRVESAEQASSRLEKERSAAERRRLRPPTSKKADRVTKMPDKPDKGNNAETKGSPEARKHWGGGMPKTENLDPENMQDGQQHTVTFLTWNIQGSRYSLYELEEQMGRWDIDVAVVTETKTANEEIKRHFRNSKQSNICTNVPKSRSKTGEDHQTAGLAVILRGEYAKPHNYTEVKVPHLQGVLTHTLLHFPGEKYLHLIGVYYPVEGKEATNGTNEEGHQEELTRRETRKGIREYVQMVTSANEGNSGETALVCGDLNATTGKPMNSRDRDRNKAAPPAEQHGLHLPKTLRKARDGHLRERNRCRENIGSWKKDIEARECATEEVRTTDFDNGTEEMREWEQWEREQKKTGSKRSKEMH